MFGRFTDCVYCACVVRHSQRKTLPNGGFQYEKFDFVAELLAHGFHDDTKPEAVELSRQAGFEGVVLSRDFTKVIESAWSGRHEYSYRVEVFVNLTQNLCRAKFFEGGMEYKCKWYYTAGKRTYNAIAATLQNAGLEI